MSADGSWQLDIESPLGKQSLWVDLKSEGDKLTGTARANGQVIDPDILDGEINNQELTWKIKCRKPVTMNMKITVVMNGDILTGKAKPGTFGTFPVTGKRI